MLTFDDGRFFDSIEGSQDNVRRWQVYSEDGPVQFCQLVAPQGNLFMAQLKATLCSCPNLECGFNSAADKSALLRR